MELLKNVDVDVDNIMALDERLLHLQFEEKFIKKEIKRLKNYSVEQ